MLISKKTSQFPNDSDNINDNNFYTFLLSHLLPLQEVLKSSGLCVFLLLTSVTMFREILNEHVKSSYLPLPYI